MTDLGYGNICFIKSSLSLSKAKLIPMKKRGLFDAFREMFEDTEQDLNKRESYKSEGKKKGLFDVFREKTIDWGNAQKKDNDLEGIAGQFKNVHDLKKAQTQA